MKKITAVVLTLCLACLPASSVLAATSTGSDNTNFSYEPVLKSQQWVETENHATRVGFCQIPQSTLNSMSTEELVEAILDYPFFMDIYAFDNVNIGMQVMASSFNGLQELANRSDAADVLLEKYESMEVLGSTFQRETQSIYELSNLGALVAQDFVTENLSVEQTNLLDAEVYKKYQEKSVQSDIYGDTRTTFYEAFNDEVVVSQSTRGPIAYVKTPKGSQVEVYNFGNELTAAEKTQMDSDMKKCIQT